MKHTIEYKDTKGNYHSCDYVSLTFAYRVYKLLCKESTNVTLTSYIDTEHGKINTFQLMHIIDDTTPYIASIANRWVERKPIDLQAPLVIHV